MVYKKNLGGGGGGGGVTCPAAARALGLVELARRDATVENTSMASAPHAP